MGGEERMTGESLRKIKASTERIVQSALNGTKLRRRDKIIVFKYKLFKHEKNQRGWEELVEGKKIEGVPTL